VRVEGDGAEQQSSPQDKEYLQKETNIIFAKARLTGSKKPAFD
jgi:hypothetical protein